MRAPERLWATVLVYVGSQGWLANIQFVEQSTEEGFALVSLEMQAEGLLHRFLERLQHRDVVLAQTAFGLARMPRQVGGGRVVGVVRLEAQQVDGGGADDGRIGHAAGDDAAHLQLRGLLQGAFFDPRAADQQCAVSGDIDRFGTQDLSRITRHDFIGVVPYLVAGAVLGFVSIGFQLRTPGAVAALAEPFWNRLVASGWILWFYLYKALLPIGLTQGVGIIREISDECVVADGGGSPHSG